MAELVRIGMVHRGEYNPATLYGLWDVVTSGGCTYTYIAPEPASGKPLPVWPETITTWWVLTARRGLNIEMRPTDTAIQWRLEGGEWADVISIATMTEAATQAAASATQAGEKAAAAQSAQEAAQTARGGAETARDEARDKVNSITGMTAGATTLDPGSNATANAQLVDGVIQLSLGIPRGEKGEDGDTGSKGDKGDKGDTGADFRLLGLYPTLPDLQSAHPTGAVGDAYAIGTPETNTIYIWSPDTASWVDVGPLQGPPGTQGQPGATPVRGTDYWTPDDIAAIKSYVDDAILGGEW